MDLQSGYPFWLIRDGLPFSYPRLECNIAADVVVLGGGISGALMAWHLTLAGVSCVLIDRRTIGLGSTCASTSLLQYEIDTPLSELIHLRGEKAAVRAYRLCNEAIHALAQISHHICFPHFSYRNSLYFAPRRKDKTFIETEYKARKTSGFDVQLLSAGDIQNTYGFSAASGILSSLAAQMDAYGFTHALLQHAIGMGLSVFDRTNVINIEHQKYGVKLKTADNIKINARKLVYATGYESVRYIRKNIVTLQSTYATISEQFNHTTPFWKDEILLWNTNNPYLYLRTTDDKRIIIGGRDEPYYHPHRRDRLIRRKAAMLSLDFRQLFPHIPFRSEFSWTGTFGSTKDGLPFIGRYKPFPHSFFALGFGGNGITFSVIAAEIITQLILGRRQHDTSLFAFDRV